MLPRLLGPNRVTALALCAALAAACSDVAQTGAEPSAGATSSERLEPTDDTGMAASSQGEITAPSQAHDFGEVYPATLQAKTFEFEAGGEVDLVVTELRHSCDCTEGKLYVLGAAGERSPIVFGQPYPPRTRFELDATLNTLGKVGEQHQAVHVILAGEGHLETFTLDAVIQPYLIAEPPVLKRDGVSPYDGLDEDVVLRARHGGRFAVSVARQLQCEDVEIELTPEAPDDDGRAEAWTLTYRLRPTASDTTSRCRIILETDVPNEAVVVPPSGDPDADAFHRFDFRTQIQIVPVLKAWPSSLDFGRIRPKWPATRRFVIRSIDRGNELAEPTVRLLESGQRDTPFAGADSIEVTTRRNEDGDWEIELRIEPPARTGPFQFIIAVEVNHPLQERLTVSARGFSSS